MTPAERAKRNATNHALRALPSLADAHKYGWRAKTRREWLSAYRYVRLLSHQGRVSFRVAHPHPEGPDTLRNTLTAAATIALLVREGWSLGIARTPSDAALAMSSPHMGKRLARHGARRVTIAEVREA
jgi:hypothetical protein